MSAVHRRVLKAENVGVVIQPLTRDDATGAFSASGSAFTVTGRAGALSVRKSRETERVDSDDMTGADRDWSKEDWELTAEALKLIVGSAGDLEDVFDTSPWAQVLVQWSRAGVNRPRYFIGLVREFSWDKSVLKNVDRLTIERVDLGETDNPATTSQL